MVDKLVRPGGGGAPKMSGTAPSCAGSTRCARLSEPSATLCVHGPSGRGPSARRDFTSPGAQGPTGNATPRPARLRAGRSFAAPLRPAPSVPTPAPTVPEPTTTRSRRLASITGNTAACGGARPGTRRNGNRWSRLPTVVPSSGPMSRANRRPSAGRDRSRARPSPSPTARPTPPAWCRRPRRDRAVSWNRYRTRAAPRILDTLPFLVTSRRRIRFGPVPV